jgi:hypothetical protein
MSAGEIKRAGFEPVSDGSAKADCMAGMLLANWSIFPKGPYIWWSEANVPHREMSALQWRRKN